MREKMWLFGALIMVLSIMLFTTSCNKEVVQTEQVTTTEPEVQKVPDVTTEEDGQLIEQLQEEAAAREVFVPQKVQFAYDSAMLSDQARQVLNDLADYLLTNQDIVVTVEGHCDNRGTDEYNVALGDRRAESVKGFLVASGIGPARLKTVSYGEERPIAMGDNEASWAQNRRAEFEIN